jgi:hypothetical protein
MIPLDVREQIQSLNSVELNVKKRIGKREGTKKET